MDLPASGPGTIAISKWLALTAMMFAVAMTFIDQTIVAIAAPDVQSELSLTATGVTWMINAYILALAAGFALGGLLHTPVTQAELYGMAIAPATHSSSRCCTRATG